MSIEGLNTKEDLLRFIREGLEKEPLAMGAVDGLQQAITPGKWEPLTLLNGFSNYAGGFSPAAYRMIPGGGVQLRGLVQRATEAPAFTAIAAPAAALMPKEGLIFDVNSNLSGKIVTRVDVNPSGIFLTEAGIPTWVSLSQIIFWPGS